MLYALCHYSWGRVGGEMQRISCSEPRNFAFVVPSMEFEDIPKDVIDYLAVEFPYAARSAKKPAP
jgi:hypothetical protein